MDLLSAIENIKLFNIHAHGTMWRINEYHMKIDRELSYVQNYFKHYILSSPSINGENVETIYPFYFVFSAV